MKLANCHNQVLRNNKAIWKKRTEENSTELFSRK